MAGRINTSAFTTALTALAKELTVLDTELQRDARISPEDQLKTPVHNFLTATGEALNRRIGVTTEHRQTSEDHVVGVRLDMAIKDAHSRLIGHIELKAPDKSANPYRKAGWSKHDKDQWKKLAFHPNLIYCNGWEWTLLRHGAKKPIMHVVLTPDSTGAIPNDQATALSELISSFLAWKPVTPSTPKALATTLAPLTAFLRDAVLEVITDDNPDNLDQLYAKWKADLMPGAKPKEFADSFAQTFTYALLLARVESDVPAEEFNASALTDSLRSNGHRLIGGVLAMMAQNRYRHLVEGPVSILEATIGAVEADKFTAKSDPWLYFYEDFLGAYDPKMRKESGVYYTPVEIVRAQVRLLDDILRTRFGRTDGLGNDDVNILDPAAGTATYPLAVIEHVLGNSPAPLADARSLAKRLFGFELMVGPYSVAHLRMTQQFEAAGITVDDGVQVYLTNTLTDPGEVAADNEQMSFWEVEAEINEETRKAGLVKKENTPIRVILGNPPYFRTSRKKMLESGSKTHRNVILEKTDKHPALLDDFTRPLSDIGAGGQAKNLYNLYVFFMRWAMWKACQQHPNDAGVVSFITSSSYLRGPGFAGVREQMRRVFDEVWIIDLGGEGRGARPEENVFAIQTPVAIFFGIQHEKTSSGTKKKPADRHRQKAKVYYQRITGTKKDKLAAMNQLQRPESSTHWEEIKAEAWTDKFVPSTTGALSDGIPLDWVFPWSISGAQYKRKWPIAPTSEALEARWKTLFADGDADSELFGEDRDLTVHSSKRDLLTGQVLPPLNTAEAKHSMAEPVRYGYRSFDRQWCLPDHRVGTYIRQQLWDSLSDQQLFLTTMNSAPLGDGPAVAISPYVPDMDAFRGSFGAKAVYPLFRENSANSPNVAARLTTELEHCYGAEVSPEQIAAYVVGLLGTGAYTARFSEELAESPAYVLFTSDYSTFQEVAEFGRDLIFEGTWGERCGGLNEFGQPTKQRFVGSAQLHTTTPQAAYPESWNYDPETRQLEVGAGKFTDVPPEVMDYEVSGMKVVGSWLSYRMKTPGGKSTSPLDKIQAPHWSHDRELLELLWQVEFFIKAEPRGKELLNKVIAGDLIPPVTLGPPTAAEQEKPAPRNQRTLDF